MDSRWPPRIPHTQYPLVGSDVTATGDAPSIGCGHGKGDTLSDTNIKSWYKKIPDNLFLIMQTMERWVDILKAIEHFNPYRNYVLSLIRNVTTEFLWPCY